MTQEVQLFLYLTLGLILFGAFIILFVFVIVDVLRAVVSNRKERWIEKCIEWYNIWWNNLKRDAYIGTEWLLNNSMNINNQEITHLCFVIKNMEYHNENRGRKVG